MRKNTVELPFPVLVWWDGGYVTLQRCTAGLWSGHDEDGEPVDDIRFEFVGQCEDMKGWLRELTVNTTGGRCDIPDLTV